MQVRLGPRATVGRRLVHRHDVWGGEAEVLVVCAGDPQKCRRQVPSFAVVQLIDRCDMPARVDVHLIRPSSGIWHEGGNRLLGEDDAWPILLCLELVAVQASAWW